MTDNTVTNLATVAGGDVIATEDIGPGVKFQTVKITLGVHGTNSGPVANTNPLPTYFPSVTPVDRSGTITTGAVAQVLAAANAARKAWWIRNNSTGSLWVSDLTTAVASQPSLEVKPGELYESMCGLCSSSALSIIGATTGQAFTAREL